MQSSWRARIKRYIAVLLFVRVASNEVRCSQVGYFVVRKKSFKALAREIHFIVLAHLPYFNRGFNTLAAGTDCWNNSSTDFLEATW